MHNLDPSRVTREDLRDPTIDAETLREIALARPDLRQIILQHPNCHSEIIGYILELQKQFGGHGQWSQPSPDAPPPPGQYAGHQNQYAGAQQGYGYQSYGGPYGVNPSVSPSDEKIWGVLMHLGGLLFSFVVPLIIWLIYRERSYTLDQQGRAALNWAISYWIYTAVSWILAFILIGFVTWGILIVLDIVFAIIAAVKAADREPWKYPLSIPFLRVNIR